MYRPTITLLLLISIAVPSSHRAVGQVVESTKQMKQKVGDHQLQYLLQEPNGTKPKSGWPLLLFLHGYGECGTDIELVKVHGPPKLKSKFKQLDQCVIVAPQCPKQSWWRVAALRELLNEVAKERGDIDSNRIYVSGLSMGGYGTWSLLSHYPGLFAAAIPVCGGGDPLQLPRRTSSKKSGIKNEFQPDGLKKVQIPIWTFHGSKDTAVPQLETEQLISLLKEAGRDDVKFTIYPEAGHVGAWQKAYGDPKTWEWLFNQKR